MPTYEYECKTCGTTFDLFQPITADPIKRHMCEKCKKVRPVRRLLGTGGALIFKGSGFYTTDYRGESYKKAVKLTFAKGASVDDPKKLFNSSLEGTTRRALDVHEDDVVDEKAFKNLIRAAVKVNKKTSRA